MTSELLSKLILSTQEALSTSPPSKNGTSTPIDPISQKTNLNINAEKFVPLKEKSKLKLTETHPKSIENKNYVSISPSFSHYINPERLSPYDDMLNKNVRTFNLLQNSEKNEETKLENSKNLNKK